MATRSASSTNLAPNLASALCYVPFIGWVAAIVLLLVERNSTVKWHAVQSLLLGLAVLVLITVLGSTLVLAILVPFVWVAGLVIQLFLAVKAYQGATVKLPLLSGWVDKIIKKV
ncbi:MAG: DUF4870 domain-containing protein [bacterium]|nr:DUF4870 domain-containing protein [bacterium]